MPRNPFQYGSPVDAEHFAGRVQELRSLTSRMEDGINVVLISPRRYGKTSLLLRAEDQLRLAKAAIVHVDVLLCATPAEFAARLASEAYHLRSGRWHRAKNAVAEFAHRLQVTPTVTLGTDGSPQFSFSGDLSEGGVTPVLEDVYALLADEVPKRPAVLALDEFQAVTDLGAYIPGALKALSDRYGRVSLVVAGSQQHLMERLTGSSGAPLYGMAERINLGPVEAGDMIAYLCRQAGEGGKPITADVARMITEMGGPVPNDIQRLAYSAYGLGSNKVGVREVEDGMLENVLHDAGTYVAVYASLAPGQRRVLRALASHPEREVFSARFVQSVDLANAASVRKAIDALSATETIRPTEGGWTVSDPFFAYWLRELVLATPRF